ncbi:acyltransferase family protein [Spirosoma pollinicola]|uniref:Acyltransferase n=1 Tax=Spirosoma pollinicola TaxID=2057025 RepID=A0A2K8YVW2_9BACT|nr:acyltransferase family protein [Spirosoma pollinicola]AUD01698.1 acyltransferase [Spirosoma pollinicola]
MQPTEFSATNRAASADLSLRRYDLDWLRIIAILILLFYHTGMIYVSWGWHIKSAEHSTVMEQVMRWLHRWRMPLLFFISGAGTFFALKKRSYGTYAGERVRRLFVPLVFGMFVIVPPQIYIEWLFRGRFSGRYIDFYPEVFKFQAYHDGGKGGAFSWHHLWFICYLFFYSLISIPVFRWLKSEQGQRFMDKIGRLIARPGGVMWSGFGVIFISQLLLKPYFPEETHALVNDWAYFVKNLLLFWFGYILISRPAFWQILNDQRRILLAGTLVCTVLLYAIGLVYDTEGPDILAWEIAYLTNSDCLMWFSVLATVAYGHRYLNVNRPILPKLNEAVYPFYILHQTVIILIGYTILTRTRLGVYDGFLVISLSSLVVCVAIYLLLIRPFKLTRFLFGMK